MAFLKFVNCKNVNFFLNILDLFVSVLKKCQKIDSWVKISKKTQWCKCTKMSDNSKEVTSILIPKKFLSFYKIFWHFYTSRNSDFKKFSYNFRYNPLMVYWINWSFVEPVILPVKKSQLPVDFRFESFPLSWIESFHHHRGLSHQC